MQRDASAAWYRVHDGSRYREYEVIVTRPVTYDAQEGVCIGSYENHRKVYIEAEHRVHDGLDGGGYDVTWSLTEAKKKCEEVRNAARKPE